MQPAEPDIDTNPELLVSYDHDASIKLATVSNGTGTVMRQFIDRNHAMVEHSQPDWYRKRQGHAQLGQRLPIMQPSLSGTGNRRHH
ncbi:hypothetical protein F2P45_33570 [Massilia sp. CCM 8733]|uniref:Uncharacterized protein n=1 Tax=Massilia mucilaginosa TaxID=2609282 RepID=A0ABX0P500_9BURK|nr:hypothetical protein [Massilia mucilaginosa]NHZ93890.1 hypothetical protein [Massilia mucilaginosa]